MTSPNSSSLRVGLVFETFETYARQSGAPPDAHAEYEPESTVSALEAAIRWLGHTPVRLGSPHDLLGRLGSATDLGVDAALNIAEGFGSRNREAWAPVLLEMAGVPTLGSDALTLSTTLDKAWANRRVEAAGIRVAPQCVLGTAADPDGSDAAEASLTAAGLAFPLFVKPRWEGSAKGIRQSSRVESLRSLRREVGRIVRDYGQAALVEAFIAGPEYTVAIVGNDPPRALPALQRAIDANSGIGVHALEAAGETDLTPILPGELSPEVERRLCEQALRVFAVLECLDFARLDFRLDDDGAPVFLEINPLPTFAVDGTFAILAELEGRSMTELLADILHGGLARLGLADTADTANTERRAAVAGSG